jgi:hypothetical protein
LVDIAAELCGAESAEAFAQRGVVRRRVGLYSSPAQERAALRVMVDRFYREQVNAAAKRIESRVLAEAHERFNPRISDRSLLERVANKVDEMHTSLFGSQVLGDKGFVGETKQDIEEHAKRLKAIERWMYTVIGAVMIIAFLVGEHMVVVRELNK